MRNLRALSILLCSLFIGTFTYAQISVPAGDTIRTAKNLNNVLDVATYFHVTNTSSTETIPTLWRMTSDANTFPAEWQYYFCDNNNCYLPWIKECPAGAPNDIGPNETYEWILHCEHFGVSGTHVINVEFFSAFDPEVIMDSVSIEVTASEETLVSTISIVDNDMASVFPNPIQDRAFIQLDMESGNDVVLEISDLSGRIIDVQDYGYQSKNARLQYDVNALNNGIYVFKVRSSGKVSSSKVSVMR
jgi:hypothetical protein